MGLVLERDDPKAFGDKIGGAVYFAAALLILLTQHRLNRTLVRAAE
jgi:hypothetical protein